ncbi:MAG: hypothetical protein OEO23_13700, partial [Gemmatimonadota bacterium]|nr:hypothetical protein [Gemmatimonadota bacterium]
MLRIVTAGPAPTSRARAKAVWAILLILTLPGPAAGQTSGADVTVLRAARLLDGTGGPLQTPGVVVLEG